MDITSYGSTIAMRSEIGFLHINYILANKFKYYMPTYEKRVAKNEASAIHKCIKR